jgi:hypothetical protein
VLLIADAAADSAALAARIRQSAADPELEIIETTIAAGVSQSFPT